MGSRRLESLPDCVLELHIEQGPVLEKPRRAPRRRLRDRGSGAGVKTFEGRADHAGTTPMEARADALVEAARFVLHVRESARRRGRRHGGRDRGRAERVERRSGPRDGLASTPARPSPRSSRR